MESQILTLVKLTFQVSNVRVNPGLPYATPGLLWDEKIVIEVPKRLESLYTKRTLDNFILEESTQSPWEAGISTYNNKDVFAGFPLAFSLLGHKFTYKLTYKNPDTMQDEIVCATSSFLTSTEQIAQFGIGISIITITGIGYWLWRRRKK